MRTRRMKPIAFLLLGAVATSFLLFYVLQHEGRLLVQLDVAKMENSRAITDDDMLIHYEPVDVFRLKELFSEKMKYLEERKMIKKMRKRPNCTKELLNSAPGAWCHDLTCKESLAPTGSTAVFQSIAKPLNTVYGDTYRRIQLVFGADKLPKRKYVFLLAISENHYLESMATIQSLHTYVFPQIRNFSFYVYDMGITAQQRKMLETYGQATVRKYPFEMLPERVHRMKTYTWKPVLIQAHIDVGEFVVYMDASVRFKTTLVPLFDTLTHTGFLMTRGFHALALQTSERMFSYFGDSACAYASYVEFEGAFIAFHNQEFSRKLLLEPWVACALNPLCMAVKGASLGCNGSRHYGHCHRFDLSAMTLMMVKLFREEMSTFEAPRSKYHYVKQGRTNVTNYLEELSKKTLQM